MATSTNYVTINPCRMCQPIGTIFALKGIEKSILLLHGSQGCATYMRRHISGHFNEPIDVASSALHEKGAIHGGETNLKQALKNVIAKYHPRLIGVATTCLAETIGDDVDRILSEFREELTANPSEGTPPPIIAIRTPSYSASHVRGFDAALLAVAEHLTAGQARIPPGEAGRTGTKINLMPGNLSPGDLRHLKDILESFPFIYTLFPDVSETLDAPMGEGYSVLPDGGTTLEEINKMGEASATVRFGSAIDPEVCTAGFLSAEFGVPAQVIPVPIGLDGTDRLMSLLSHLADRPVPHRHRRERGRLLDAMVDAHKVVFGMRPVIYGDPALVEGLTRFCQEIGMDPALSATGEELDFSQIYSLTREKGGNLLLGNSDGAFIAEDLGIPLIRIGFPISDRLGAQRQVIIGYEGALRLLDRITDAIQEARDREGPSVFHP